MMTVTTAMPRPPPTIPNLSFRPEASIAHLTRVEPESRTVRPAPDCSPAIGVCQPPGHLPSLAAVQTLRVPAPELAQVVLEAPEAYTEMDRLLLYEALGTSAERFHNLILNAVQHEPAPDNVILLDRALCAAIPDYRMSYEREAALARFEKSEVPRWKDYFTAELALLRQAPADQRTHVAALEREG